LAQAYLILVCLLGLASVGVLNVVSPPSTQASLFELAIFATLATLAGGKKVSLIRRVGEDDAVSMSLGFVITFAGMLRFGPAGALSLGVLSCLSGCVYPKKQPLYQIFFNVALSALEALIGSFVYLWLNGGTLELRPVETFIAVCASTVVFFGVNTGGVAIIIALCSNCNPIKVWKETFLWTAPSYFAGACVSALAMVMFGHNIGPILLFVTPVAYLMFQSYSVYTSRAEEKVRHLEEMQSNQMQLADLYLATIKSLALAIDAKDQYTHQHILRVQRYAVAIAKHMGLSGGDLEAVNTGALLHDIGKLGVPEYVLLKPGRLTEEEFAMIKKHPEIGAAILDPVEFPWPVLPVVKYHHEKWDGSGYPEGLKGENIPLNARIMAVADVYDALTSSRSYRGAWSHEKALGVIQKDAGTHFDPIVVDAFSEIIQGVIEEMAEQGEGPLVAKTPPEGEGSKTAQAAQDISRTSTDLWALYEVAQTLSSSLGLSEMMDILGRRLEGIFPGGTCLFLLREEKGPKLRVRTAIGLNASFFEGAYTVNEFGSTSQVAIFGKTYVGEYDQEDFILSASESTQWTPLRSAIVVPIRHGEEVIGTLNLYQPGENAFSDHDRQMLENIADRAAMALYSGIFQDRTRGHERTDPLTGAHNIHYLTQYIDGRCAQPETSDRFSLVCLDLDCFKPINDNFGHHKGDQVLQEIARLLRNAVRDCDIVARYSGDEFLIVLEGADRRVAEETASRLEALIAAHDAGLVHVQLGPLQMSASVGVSCFPEDGKDCATLLSVADLATNRSKSARKLGALATPARSRKKAA